MLRRTVLSLLAFVFVACASAPPSQAPVYGALQFSTGVRNALLDAIEVEGGTSVVLKGRSGSVPATCATADAGTVLFSITAPSDWAAAASSGSKAKSGTWSDSSADNTGTAAHFRLYKSDGTTCIIQGTITATGGGGDLTLDSTSITSGQTVTVTTFTLTAPGAWLMPHVRELEHAYTSSQIGAARKGSEWTAGASALSPLGPDRSTASGDAPPAALFN